MTGEAGHHIPEKCVPMRHCGTHAPGWLNGKHPTIQEGVVTREVCYHWKKMCCYWKNFIKIRNCGSYYVYELSKPPACHLRYCGKREGEYSAQLLSNLERAPRASKLSGRSSAIRAINLLS